MLSRIAESLYWIGRYVERADDTARILDVHLHRMLQDPWVDEEVACRSLVSVMGLSTVDEACSRINDAVSRRYFRQTSAVHWVPA
jgi:uncharacterized alpha-E superfamily protein